jgi:hypothetical protein
MTPLEAFKEQLNDDMAAFYTKVMDRRAANPAPTQRQPAIVQTTSIRLEPLAPPQPERPPDIVEITE